MSKRTHWHTDSFKRRASEISISPIDGIQSPNVQGAIEEIAELSGFNPDVETQTGAQAKADQAEQNAIAAAKNYTDERLPAGIIAMWSGAINNIPPGWALCDGTNGTPDLRDRFIVGAGGEYSVGATGGAKEVTLTTEQIPRHYHDLRAGSLTGSGDFITDPALLIDATGAVYDSSLRTLALGTSYTGGGQPHENRPPYYALAYIMKL